MILLFMFLLFIPSSLCFSDPSHSDQNINISFIKQNYMGHEPIEILFSILNTTNKEQTFLLSDILSQSFVFDLRTSKNEIIPMIPLVEAQLNTSYANPNLYRIITLLQGESFSRIFNLRDFFDINNYEIFYVRGIFYPDPDNRGNHRKSSFVSFTHIPPKIVQEQMSKDAVEEEKEIEILVHLAPHQIADSLFKTQQKKNWPKFLLHFDCEKLIYSFPNYSKQYDAVTDGSFKLSLLEQFKQYLTDHWNISLSQYQVIKTTIEGNISYVTVDATEDIYAISRRIRYNFTMYQTKSGQWLISDYTALVLN